MKRTILYLFLCLFTLIASAAAKEIVFLDPVVVGQSLSDLSESQHSPNLLFDSSGYTLTYHINGSSGNNIKTIRLQTEPQFNTTEEYFLFDSTQNPLLPTMYHFGNKNILFYYDQFEDERTHDSLYTQKLLIYDTYIPTEENLDKMHSFYAVSSPNNRKPLFAQTGDRTYCQILKNELPDPNNNKYEYFLRSLDLESNDLYSPILHFSANGQTAILPYGDSLFIVKSWIFCTSFENLTCSQWATGYKGYVIYKNKIQSIYSLYSHDVTESDQQPDDIFLGKVKDDYVFALRQSNQLKKINFETMRFEDILDLSLYTDQSYKKIIPLQTIDYCIAILIGENNDGTIMRFDDQFQFIDSVTIPFKGKVSEISDFVYDEVEDRLSYAYATELFDDNPISYIFLQSVLFDKELVLNPPPELPTQFTLLQNYPNPFNPTTTINYSIPQNGHLTVDIYNMLGQKVSTLYDNNQSAGEHSLNWDASEQSSGMYLFKVSYEDQTKSIKTMLLK